MSLESIRESQARKKAEYQASPDAARQTLSARGRIELDRLAVVLDHPPFLSPAGLHPAGGGTGECSCPVELLLAGLASCAGVTLAAVAAAMRLPLSAGSVVVEGDLDFRGTLAVDRAAPVGLTGIRMNFELTGSAEPAQLDKLVELTHRYCVVYRTLDAPPAIRVTVRQESSASASESGNHRA